MLLLILATGFTKAFEDHPPAGDRERLGDRFRNIEAGIAVIFEIDYFPASRAVQMVMLTKVGVEPLGPTEHFNHIHDADLREGQERAVDRIKRDIGKGLADRLEHQIRRGMLFRLNQFPVNGDTLRGNLKLMPAAGFHEPINMFINFFILHIKS
jgi:hypothetical protein